MESLIYHLINHIKENMPSLSMVDEDYGQLEAIDKVDMDTYSVTFPAVLVNIPETEWSNLSVKSQKGKAKVNVRLIIDCYDDTHFGSGTIEKTLEREEMADTLHKILQGFRPEGDGELNRELSRFYTWSHGIKIYEFVYSLVVSDINREIMKVHAPGKIVISAKKL